MLKYFPRRDFSKWTCRSARDSAIGSPTAALIENFKYESRDDGKSEIRNPVDMGVSKAKSYLSVELEPYTPSRNWAGVEAESCPVFTPVVNWNLHSSAGVTREQIWSGSFVRKTIAYDTTSLAGLAGHLFELELSWCGSPAQDSCADDLQISESIECSAGTIKRYALTQLRDRYSETYDFDLGAEFFTLTSVSVTTLVEFVIDSVADFKQNVRPTRSIVSLLTAQPVNIIGKVDAEMMAEIVPKKWLFSCIRGQLTHEILYSLSSENLRSVLREILSQSDEVEVAFRSADNAIGGLSRKRLSIA